MNAPIAREALANPLQGTPEWLSQRAGCLTASRMAAALDVLKNGSPGAKRRDLIKALLAERMTGDTVRGFFSSSMQWGVDTEPMARAEYENTTGRIVELVGFIPHPNIEFCGASPDGLVEDTGLIEIKCPETTTHVSYLMAGAVPEDYRPQMLLQLACTGRQWVDFVSFDPRVRDERRRLFVRRFEPEADLVREIEQKAREFLAEVDAAWETITTTEV